MTAGVVVWGVTVAGAAGIGLVVALLARRRRPARRPEPLVAAAQPPGPPPGQATVPPGHDQRAQDQVAVEEGKTPGDVVRFDVHVVFAERRETHLIVDVLADLADGRGAVLGVPASLILQRPPNAQAENVLLSLMEETGDHGCQVEVDLTVEQASVKMSPSGRELSIPIRAASGLPLAS